MFAFAGVIQPPGLLVMVYMIAPPQALLNQSRKSEGLPAARVRYRAPSVMRHTRMGKPIVQKSIEPEDWEHQLDAIARRSDRVAFEKLFLHFGPRIKAYLMKLGSESNQAEDLMQDVMAQVWRKSTLFDKSKAGAATWIFTIARNLRTPVAPQWHPAAPLWHPTAPLWHPSGTPVAPHRTPVARHRTPVAPQWHPAAPQWHPAAPLWHPTAPQWHPTAPLWHPVAPHRTPVAPQWHPHRTGTLWHPVAPHRTPVAPHRTGTPVAPQWHPAAPQWHPTAPQWHPAAPTAPHGSPSHGVSGAVVGVWNVWNVGRGAGSATDPPPPRQNGG